MFDPDRIDEIERSWRHHVTDAMTPPELAELDRIADALKVPLIGHISARRFKVFAMLSHGDIERDADGGGVRFSAAYVARNAMPPKDREWKYSYQGD
jgi:hypothetical protein